ncbi:hypothetical protein [Amycolatopsis sp. lyj-112]|uniref:hypothetical protein n=1 Tax=Amycolatopsis sp. lyj-112 TaxID=2789288 RepID=UPI003978427E
MSIQIEGERVEGADSTKAVEAALRWLAKRKDCDVLDSLRYGIEDPSSEAADVLDCMVGKTASMLSATSESRALALWGLLLDEIGKIGSVGGSRRRNVLIAAFRLQPERGSFVKWEATLGRRFGQLRSTSKVFGNPVPVTTTPMDKAWSAALKRLAPCLWQRLEELGQDGESWPAYEELGRVAAVGLEGEASSTVPVAIPSQRAPSEGAQPVFVDFMIVTVMMKRRVASRRMTERHIIAREDGVESYLARALTGWTDELAPIPINAMWGCRVETSAGRHPGDPIMVGLRFPKVLSKGDRHRFISEALEDDLDEKRFWINVDVDHHGIAPGTFGEDGEPKSGLTIRINFEDDVPDACWWYAEQTDYERLIRPPAGDRHLLEIRQGSVQHTFLRPCRPREDYGIAFRWPQQ